MAIPAKQTQTDTVRMYIELIQEERHKISDALEAIADYSHKLHLATTEAQQRLIGHQR
jgi:hypothetical protein